MQSFLILVFGYVYIHVHIEIFVYIFPIFYYFKQAIEISVINNLLLILVYIIVNIFFG